MGCEPSTVVTAALRNQGYSRANLVEHDPSTGNGDQGSVAAMIKQPDQHVRAGTIHGSSGQLGRKAEAALNPLSDKGFSAMIGVASRQARQSPEPGLPAN